MKKLKVFIGIVFLIEILCSSITVADTSLGVRIPTAYIATTGVGQSNDGIPPDPYGLLILQRQVSDNQMMGYRLIPTKHFHMI